MSQRSSFIALVVFVSVLFTRQIYNVTLEILYICYLSVSQGAIRINLITHYKLINLKHLT